MAASRKLDIQITAESKDAERAFDRLGKSAKDAEKDLSKVGESNPFGKLSDAADDAGGGLMDKFKGLGDGAMSALSGGITAGVGALAVGAGVAAGVFADAFGEALEQENVTARLGAQLGLKGADVEKAGRIAGDLYLSGMGDSMGDAAEVVKAVQFSLGDLTQMGEDEFRDLTGIVGTFTDMLGQDVTGAVGAVSRMMANKLAPNAEEALNILTKGIQEGDDLAGDLLDTFTEYDTMFASLGLSGQEAMGLITQGMDAGARNSDLLADALKEFSIRAKDGSDLTAQSFRDLGLDAGMMADAIASGGETAAAGLDVTLDKLREIEDPVARNAAAVGLFGTQAEDLQGALFALDPSNAVAALGETEGAVRSLNDGYDTNAQKLEVLKRQGMQVLVDYISTSVIPKLYELKIWFARNAEQIQTLGDWSANVGHFLATAFVGWIDWTTGGLRRLYDMGRLVVDIFDRIADMARNAMGAIKGALDKLASLSKMPSFGPGPGGFLGGLFAGMFDQGGVVPGPMGSAQWAVVHGGETILPTHQGPVAIAGVGRGGANITINADLRGVIGSGWDDPFLQRQMIDAINDAMGAGYRLQSSGRGL